MQDVHRPRLHLIESSRLRITSATGNRNQDPYQDCRQCSSHSANLSEFKPIFKPRVHSVVLVRLESCRPALKQLSVPYL